MTPPSIKLSGLVGIGLKLAVLIAIIIGGRYACDWALEQLNPVLAPGTAQPDYRRAIMVATAVYTLLMTLPFIPGAEIGIGLLMAFGARVAPLVYASTVVALSVAFLIGRLVPEAVIIDLFRRLRLTRAANLLGRLQPLPTEERLAFLLQSVSGPVLPILLRYRFLMLVLALNLPGNTVIGGGGGICIAAGFCRMFSFPAFLLTVACAVAPVPLLIYLTG